MASTIGKILNYGTPLGWASMGLNKAGVIDGTYGSAYDSLANELSGAKGLETAAEGARKAQEQANALSDLQWQRQMQGLSEARGQTQPYLALLDKMYGTQMAGHVTPVGGMGLGTMGGPRAGGQAPYVQSAAPRMVGPGQFMPASRVAGDAMLRGRIAERVGGSSNSLPGGPAYAGLPNGNAATPYIPQGQDTMQTQDLLGQWLRSRG